MRLTTSLDVLEAARLLQMFVEGVDWDTFENDLMRRAAVMLQRCDRVFSSGCDPLVMSLTEMGAIAYRLVS